MRDRRLALLIGLAVALAAREAHGDDIVHIKSPSTVTTEKGSVVQLPPGYFLDEASWHALDIEMRRLQDAETRLTAENQSLRKSADDTPWVKIAAGVMLGLAGGAVGFWYATK